MSVDADVKYSHPDQAIVPAGQTLTVALLRVGRDGVAALWTDWEHFSFAHPGASVVEFLNASGARSI